MEETAANQRWRCRCPMCREEIEIAAEPSGRMCKCPLCSISFDPSALPRTAISLEVGRDSSSAEAHRELEAADRSRLVGLLLDKELKFRSLPILGRGSLLPTGFGSRLRAFTAVSGVMLLACIGAAALGFSKQRVGGAWTNVADYLVLLGIFGGLIAVLIFVPRAIQDLRLPGPVGRGDPVRGLKAFLLGIHQGRFEYAYQCLLPSERDSLPRLCPTNLLGSSQQAPACSFLSVDGFRSYWQPFLRPSALQNRSVAVDSFLLAKQSDSIAEVTCAVQTVKQDVGKELLSALIAHLIGFAVVQRSVLRIELRKLLRRVDDQWYLVSGELAGPEDGAFDEAARIAALSDAAIKAELAALAAEPPK